MIGKARLVSASPFRASLKIDKDNNLNNGSDDEDDEFQREDLPELHKSRESPIKDDSELLRHQKNELLTAFVQPQRAGGGLDHLDNKSERTPKIAGGDLKGIMIHETRSSFDRSRNSGAAAFPQANHYQTPVRDNKTGLIEDDSVVL